MALQPSTTYQGSFYAKAEARHRHRHHSPRQRQDRRDRRLQPLSPASAPPGSRYTFTLKTGAVAPIRRQSSGVPLRTPRHRLVSIWSRSFRPPTQTSPTATASTSWKSSPPCIPRSCASPAATISKAITSPSASIGRRPSARSSTAPRIPAPGAIARPTEWACSSFWKWCEDLNMEPVLAVYAGYSLRAGARRSGPRARALRTGCAR